MLTRRVVCVWESHAVDVALRTSQVQRQTFSMNVKQPEGGLSPTFLLDESMEPGRPRPAKKIDVGDFSLLSPCREKAALDRYFKGPRHSVRRLFSLFRDLLPTWRASAA